MCPDLRAEGFLPPLDVKSDRPVGVLLDYLGPNPQSDWPPLASRLWRLRWGSFPIATLHRKKRSLRNVQLPPLKPAPSQLLCCPFSICPAMPRRITSQTA